MTRQEHYTHYFPLYEI